MTTTLFTISILLCIASWVVLVKIYDTYLKILEVHHNKCQQYDMLLSHFMYKLMQESIEKEDYELATKCKDIIDKIGAKDIKVTITEI